MGCRAEMPPAPLSPASGGPAAYWTVEEVRRRLEEAGRTLMSLPLPRGSLPKDDRSRWPDAVRSHQDIFAALIGASPEVMQDFSDGQNRIRTVPNARAVGQMEEALDWLWCFDDPRKRRLLLARALIHPVSGRHVASFRKLGRIFGLHHETIRAWHDKALGELAVFLTQSGMSKTARPGRSGRAPWRRQDARRSARPSRGQAPP